MSADGMLRLEALDEFLLDYLPSCSDEEHTALVRMMEGYRRALGGNEDDLFFDNRELRAREYAQGRMDPRQREA